MTRTRKKTANPDPSDYPSADGQITQIHFNTIRRLTDKGSKQEERRVKVENLLIGAAIPLVAGLLTTILQLFLSRSKTRAWGYRAGRLASAFLRQKLGKKQGETLENTFQMTVSDFMEGLMEGLDSDERQ